MSVSPALLAALALLAGCQVGPPRPEECARLGADGAAELLALARADQDARAAWLAWAREHPGEVIPDEFSGAVRLADARSRDHLRVLLVRGEWPCISDVGPEAAHAAWLLVQHADDEPALQEAALALMDRLVTLGEAGRGDHALLLDRVRVAQGLPQVYGTQWRSESIDGVLHFGPATPIGDPTSVDALRASVGLTPLVDYEASLRRVYGVPEDAPPLRR